MSEKLKVGNDVCIFTKRRRRFKKDLQPFFRGKVVDCGLLKDTAFHGSPWFIDVYKVLGDDGQTTLNCYRDNVTGKAFCYTDQEAVVPLEFMILKSEDEINQYRQLVSQIIENDVPLQRVLNTLNNATDKERAAYIKVRR